jgi:protein TonB
MVEVAWRSSRRENLMRGAREPVLSRRAVAAFVGASSVLHVAGVLWLLQQSRVVGERSTHVQTQVLTRVQMPAMFGFLVRPAVGLAMKEVVPPSAPRAVAPTASRNPPVRVAAAAESTVATAVSLPAAPEALAARQSSVAEPAPATTPLDVPAAPAEEIAVARPDHAQCPPAAYPGLLREQGIEGVVRLRVRVDALGRASEVRLLQPSGWRLFDEAAMRQVRACRFVPARRGTEALASWVEFPVRFALAG